METRRASSFEIELLALVAIYAITAAILEPRIEAWRLHGHRLIGDILCIVLSLPGLLLVLAGCIWQVIEWVRPLCRWLQSFYHSFHERKADPRTTRPTLVKGLDGRMEEAEILDVESSKQQ